MSPYEILEHTADVGIQAVGGTLEECFEQAALALTEIIGILRPGTGESVRIEVSAEDRGALLVDWLSEILYLHDSRDALISGIHVDAVGEGRAAGTIGLLARGDVPIEGTQVKAITFHRLDVRATAEGYVAEVYVDV
jgi:SHS2 domain-containing protein